MFAWALAYCLWLSWVKKLTGFPWEPLKHLFCRQKLICGIETISCRSCHLVFLNKKLQSIWFTFSLMNILNIYRLDFVVQWSIWYFFDWIRLVAFQSLHTFNSSSAILKKLSSFQLGSAVLPMAFLWWCSWDSRSNLRVAESFEFFPN